LCRTALAEAEIEYNDSYCSPSVYVRYHLQQLSAALANLGNTNIVNVSFLPHSISAEHSNRLGVDLSVVLSYAVISTDADLQSCSFNQMVVQKL